MKFTKKTVKVGFVEYEFTYNFSDPSQVATLREIFRNMFGPASIPDVQPASQTSTSANPKIEKLRRVIADPAATSHEKNTARRLIKRLEKL